MHTWMDLCEDKIQIQRGSFLARLDLSGRRQRDLVQHSNHNEWRVECFAWGGLEAVARPGAGVVEGEMDRRLESVQSLEK